MAHEAARILRLAVLIDADNVSSETAARAMKAAEQYGRVTIRRAYRLWTDAQQKAWTPTLSSWAIVPVQVDPGRNATDVALVIDAMDLLHDGHIEGLCIVSGDGDFTRLAQRVREGGILVVGMGTKLSLQLRAACDEVVELVPIVEPALPGTPKPAPVQTATPKVAAPKTAKPKATAPKAVVPKAVTPANSPLEQAVRQTIKAAKPDSDGWVRVLIVGSSVPAHLKQGKFTAQLAAIPSFELQIRQFAGAGAKVHCIRIRK